MMKRISDWRLEEELQQEDSPLAVLFTAAGEIRSPEARHDFRRLAEDYHPTRFFELDLLENPSLKERFKIRRIPILMVFLQGQEQSRHTGSDFRGALRRALGHEPSPETDASADIDP